MPEEFRVFEDAESMGPRGGGFRNANSRKDYSLALVFSVGLLVPGPGITARPCPLPPETEAEGTRKNCGNAVMVSAVVYTALWAPFWIWLWIYFLLGLSRVPNELSFGSFFGVCA